MRRLDVLIIALVMMLLPCSHCFSENSLEQGSREAGEPALSVNQAETLEPGFLVLPDDSAQAADINDETLSDRELADLLYEMEKENESGADFLVLPEDYREPVTGLAGVYHLLLVGVDTDGKGITGRSDTMVLAVLDTRGGNIKLVSFMRDLYVKIYGRGHNRLNAAYAFGGPDLLVKTIKNVFQVPVDAYLAVDFGLMARLVDAIGGISMDVNEDEKNALNGILAYYHAQNGQPGDRDRLLHSGEVRLNGMQAMAYARIRKIDSDFERVGRQQNTLRAIFAQLMSLESSRIGEILLQFASEVKTDVSLSDALELIPLVFELKDSPIRSLTIPVKGGSKNVMKNKAAFLVPNMSKNLKALVEFLYTAP